MSNSRNTAVFKKIVKTLGLTSPESRDAMERLEKGFHDSLLVVAGNLTTVERHAHELRLALSQDECARVLDDIAWKKQIGVTIKQVETAAYTLFGNRFIEP